MKHVLGCSLFLLGALSAYPQAPGSGAGSSDLNSTDKTFVNTVAQTDMAEIQVGNLAVQKSSSPEIKKIGQRLVDDHTKSSGEMKQMALEKNVVLPTETDAKHKAIATKLEAEEGAKFDKDFLDANSSDHHKVVSLFQKEISGGKDPDIKGFATKFLPAIQEHTQMIDQAKSSMK